MINGLTVGLMHDIRGVKLKVGGPHPAGKGDRIESGITGPDLANVFKGFYNKK